jgi:hypothetical protein
MPIFEIFLDNFIFKFGENGSFLKVPFSLTYLIEYK